MSDSQVINITQGVASNLAFAFESPWGPAAAAGLSLIFGLFDGSGPNLLDEIQKMIAASVNEMEQYMRRLNLARVVGDASSCFGLYSDNIPRDQDGGAVSVDKIKSLLPELEKAGGWEAGTLRNNLHQLVGDEYLKPDEWVSSPDQDAVFPVLLFTLTAFIAAVKRRIRLASALASHYAPDPVSSECESRDADLQYVEAMGKWIEAVRDLQHIVQPRQCRSTITGT